MGLWTRCPEAVDCWVKPLEKRKRYIQHRNEDEEEEEPFRFESLWHKYVFEAFPVVTYIRRSTHVPCRQCSLSSAGCLLTYAVMETSAKLLFFWRLFQRTISVVKYQLVSCAVWTWCMIQFVYNALKKKDFFLKPARPALCVSTSSGRHQSYSAQAWGEEHWNVNHSVCVGTGVRSMLLCRLMLMPLHYNSCNLFCFVFSCSSL